jgi:hypothetical protein
MIQVPEEKQTIAGPFQISKSFDVRPACAEYLHECKNFVQSFCLFPSSDYQIFPPTIAQDARDGRQTKKYYTVNPADVVRQQGEGEA